MKATIKIECIGHNKVQQARMFRQLAIICVGPEIVNPIWPANLIKNRFFVAEISGFDPKYKFKRNFLKYKLDYLLANSKGSRDVYAWYILESGHIYDIKEPVSWKNDDRYFCTVTEEGEIKRLKEQEVIDWLKSH